MKKVYLKVGDVLEYDNKQITVHKKILKVNAEYVADCEIVIEPKEEFEPIAEDNIIQVLDYNKEMGLKIRDIKLYNNKICYEQLEGNEWVEFRWNLSFKNWLQYLELELGKLKPLPKKPKFDPRQYLLDNGFKQYEDGSFPNYFFTRFQTIRLYSDNTFNANKNTYMATKENLDLVIQASKLLEKLK